MQNKEQQLLDKLVSRYFKPNHQITAEHIVTALSFLKEPPRLRAKSQPKVVG